MALFRKKSVIIQLQATVQWEVANDPENGQWIGICRMLNLNAVGDTWGEFVECANEAMQLLFVDLFEEGELAAFLHRNGWRLSTPLPTHGTPTPRFDIPFDWEKTRYEELLPAGA